MWSASFDDAACRVPRGRSGDGELQRTNGARSSHGAETLELRLTTAHFRVFAGRTSATVVRSAADALEREYRAC